MIFRYRNKAFLRRIISCEHDILIEGYPRSANTYSVRAFCLLNGWRDIRIATHSHSSAQVSLACRWNVPSLIVFRDPSEAVVSLVALAIQRDAGVAKVLNQAEVENMMKVATKRFVEFYRVVLRCLDSVTLANFDNVTTDFGAVIAQVNWKYDRNFDFGEVDNDRLLSARPTRNIHVLPDRDRQIVKAELVEFYLSDANVVNRLPAEEIFRQLLCFSAKKKAEFECRTSGIRN